jgi:hypothetical protein
MHAVPPSLLEFQGPGAQARMPGCGSYFLREGARRRYMGAATQVMTGFLAAGYFSGGEEKASTTTPPSIDKELPEHVYSLAESLTGTGR